MGRNAQDDVMLFQYLAGSLTEEFEREIKADPTVYTIHNARGGYCSGLLFLKQILSQAQTANMATVNVLCRKVATLNDKMVELQGNIVEFHTYVRGLVNDFAAIASKCLLGLPSCR
jgi:hypothetical protein